MTTKRKAPTERPPPPERQTRRTAKDVATKELQRVLKLATTPLGPYPDTENIRNLIRQGANVNYNYGKAIMRAVELHRLDILKCLLDAGANLNVQNTPYVTPFTSACCLGHMDSIRMLLVAGAIVPLHDKPLHKVLVYSHHPSLEVIQLLLDQGVDVNSRSSVKGKTPLHCLVSRFGRQNATLFRMLFRVLIEAGADPSKGDYSGMTPLHYSRSYFICPEHISALLRAGSNPDLRDKKGETPMQKVMQKYSAGSANWTKNVVQSFLGNGWDPKEHGVNFHNLCHGRSSTTSIEILTLLLGHGCGVDSVDKDGHTPLQAACMHKDYDIRIVRLLLQYGANVHAALKDGKSTLFLAADAHAVGPKRTKSFFLETDPVRKEKVLQCLLNHGARVNEIDSDGWTALHHACDSGHLNTVQVLLELGADGNIANHEGLTPFQVACMAGHVPVMFFFLRFHNALAQLDW